MYIALALCLIIIVALIIKIILLKKDLREISDGFKSKSTLDTNTPVKVTSMDKDVRECASSINDTLETVRQEYHKYDASNFAYLDELGYDRIISEAQSQQNYSIKGDDIPALIKTRIAALDKLEQPVVKEDNDEED